MKKSFKTSARPIIAVLSNLLLALLLYTLTRILFLIINAGTYPGIGFGHALKLCFAGLRFDISAGLYHNIPYLAMALVPFAFRFSPGYQKALKWVFALPNAFWLICNIADSLYFPYTSRRSTDSLFTELDGEGNFLEIVAKEIPIHWWVALVTILIIWLLLRLYRKQPTEVKLFTYYDFLAHSAVLAVVAILCVALIRGTFNPVAHPITVKTANRYVKRPIEAPIVLNTAFTFYHSLFAEPYAKTDSFEDREQMEAVFTPVHKGHQGPAAGKGKNVVIFLLESFSASYSGYLSELQGHPSQGYMPFLDSLMHEGLMCRNSYSTGRKSIEAIASVMCGIPAFGEPILLTKYYDDEIGGIARELASAGYSTAFWHGARPTSLRLSTITRKLGYQNHYSRDDFADDSEFDGVWAIWDEPFIEYFKSGLDTLKQPFLASIFTATTHHPFEIPAKYKGVFDEGTIPMHKCVGYTDHALREFFEQSAGEPWFKNTVFVFVGDHTNVTDRTEYLTDNGLFEVPLLFYAPDGSLKGLREAVASHTDIMPTLLDYLGYDKDYVAFGQNLLTTSDEQKFAVSYVSGCYQLTKMVDSRLWLLQHDGIATVGLYDITSDPMMQRNLVDDEELSDLEEMLTDDIRAVEQQYMERIIDDELVARN